PLRREGNHAGATQEVIGRQSAGEARRPAGRQDVRRTRNIVTQRHWRIVANEDRASVVDPLGQRLGVARGDGEVLRGDLVDTVDDVAVVAGQDEGAKVFQRFAGQVAARQASELLL